MGECLFPRSAVPPSGFIVMWSGAVDAIPDGWALCNGANGTPDLRGRFVVGAGGTYAVNAKGGAETHRLTAGEMPSHTHKANLYTDAAGAHSHTYQVHEISGSAYTSAGSVNVCTLGATTGTTSTAGEHSHTITGSIAATGNGQAHENRPPYYALCYIMKL